MRTMRTLLLPGLVWIAIGLAAPSGTGAQEPRAAAAEADAWPEADPEDVASIDAILGALYEVISGPAGEKRDWDRFRSLHIPQARLIPTGRGQNGFGYRVMSPDDYVEASGAFLEERGFFEIEAARTTERFGDIAHAFSTYESRWHAEDPEPFQRGINSIQLMNDGERWWIITIFWAGERPDMPIPARYRTSRP